MSKNKILDNAKKLAAQKFIVRIVVDKTTDNEDIYMASNPELEGCMAQGETAQEAQALLKEVRVDYFVHLLEHELPIPEPAITITGNVEETQIPYRGIVANIGITEKEFDSFLGTVIQPTEREILLEA